MERNLKKREESEERGWKIEPDRRDRDFPPSLFASLFLSFFLVVFSGAFSLLLAPFGAHSGAFWETFRHFLELCGLLLDCTHS